MVKISYLNFDIRHSAWLLKYWRLVRQLLLVNLACRIFEKVQTNISLTSIVLILNFYC